MKPLRSNFPQERPLGRLKAIFDSHPRTEKSESSIMTRSVGSPDGTAAGAWRTIESEAEAPDVRNGRKTPGAAQSSEVPPTFNDPAPPRPGFVSEVFSPSRDPLLLTLRRNPPLLVHIRTMSEPWSDNPYAPTKTIDYPFYLQEKANFAGFLVGSILYGAPSTRPITSASFCSPQD